MTLKVVEFPRLGLNNIPAMARQFADDVEAGGYGDIDTVLVIIDTDESLKALGWGHADDSFRNIGLLHMAIVGITESI